MTEIIAAVISGVFALIVSYITHRYLVKNKPKIETPKQNKEKFREEALSPRISLINGTSFAQKVREIGNETEIDRVLLSVAFNGIDDPDHVTVIWDDRLVGESFRYVNIPTDRDYNKRLKDTVKAPHIKFKTYEAQDTLIGSIYEMEGVREAVWILIGVKKNPDTNQAAYLFMSWATHSENEISKDTMRRIHNVVTDLKIAMKEDGYVPDL